MQIPILIEPIEGGRFRAKAGEPFAASAEGQTEQEAMRELEAVVQEHLRAGSRLGFIDVANGAAAPLATETQIEQLPDDDWFFRTMREAIAENRRREDEAEG